MMRFILQMSMLTMLFFQNTSFEVASIKPSAPDSRGSDVDRDGNLLRMRNVTLKRCITRAYGVSAAQVMGGPKWVDTQTYDIEAKADPSVTDDQVNTMLQSLLANRFALSLHKETRQLSGYAMTVGAKGIVAKPAATTSCDMDRSRGHIHASACSLQQLAT
ncbi:MAG TPA: TIGR03435 family protein, partial [Acidobacteriaceae bacterium]|nr:TIGR03435 family protein [Acidobacteriaceae bacterium]